MGKWTQVRANSLHDLFSKKACKVALLARPLHARRFQCMPALGVPEYSPTAHGVHEVALAPVPKLPGSHSTQAPEESSL